MLWYKDPNWGEDQVWSALLTAGEDNLVLRGLLSIGMIQMRNRLIIHCLLMLMVTSVARSEIRVVLYTDPLSPSLWRYKNKSIWTEVDDRETLKFLRHMGVYLKRREDTDITT